MLLGVEVWGSLWGDGILIAGHVYLPSGLLATLGHPFHLQQGSSDCSSEELMTTHGQAWFSKLFRILGGERKRES